MSIETAIRYSCFHFFFNSRSLSRCVWCFSIYLFVIYHLVYFSASRYFSFCDTTDPVMMHDFYLGSCAGGRRGKGNRKENERCFLLEFGGKRNVGVHVKRHECFRTALIFRRSHSNQIASAFRVHPFNGLSCIEHEWIAPQSLLQSRKIIFNHVKENSIPTKLLSQSLLSILSRLFNGSTKQQRIPMRFSRITRHKREKFFFLHFTRKSTIAQKQPRQRKNVHSYFF